MDTTTSTILANEARRTELKTSLSAIGSEISTTANLATLLSTANSDAQRRYQQKAQELAALEAGAGPGITDDFGTLETILTAFLTKAQAGGTITPEITTALCGLAGIPAIPPPAPVPASSTPTEP